MLQSIIFITKNVSAKLGGSPFGAIHPSFVPSSQAHKEMSLVKRLAKRFSRDSTSSSEPKKISPVDPTSIAQVGTAAEHKEGNGSALESGDHLG